MEWHKSGKLRWLVVLSCCFTLFSVGYAVSQHFYFSKRQRLFIRDWCNPQIIGKPLPTAQLIDFNGQALGDDELRGGKVMLVLLSSECESCAKEGRFLKAIISKYTGLRFYGAMLFWSDRSAGDIEGKFPMKLFFDHDALLRQALEVKAVPLKIYLEEGIVKKVWAGTAVTPEAQRAFVIDLEEVCAKSATPSITR